MDLFDSMVNDEILGEEIDTAVEFRPTLVIGLGGTGQEVMVRLKARFLETFGEEIFKIVKLLVFDTAQETVTVTTELGRPVTLTKDTELINFGHVPVAGLVKNIDMHPTIKVWLPERLPVQAIHAGAKQIRPLGRLAMFYHFNQDAKVKDRLLGAIRALGNIKLRGKLGESALVARSRGINIFIICSVCGGTGSGTFLDMAYLVKHLIQFSGIPQEFCFTNGILVLPQAFATVAKDDILANAYASLRELEYYSKAELGKLFARYPDGTVVTIQSRPFNICYLVDAVNEHGKLLSGLEDLSPMIAESVFLQIASQVGQATKSVFDNVKSLDDLALNPEGEESPTAFSSLSAAALVFPARWIISTCAYRFGHQFISEGLLREADPRKADEGAKLFIEQTKLPPKPLLTELARDAQGNVITIRLSATPLEDVPDDQLLRQMDMMLGRYENTRLRKDFQKALDVNVQKMNSQVAEAIQKETARLVDNPEYGPRYALGFLENLSARYDRLIALFAKERAQITEQLKRGKKQRDGLRQALENAIGSFVIGRGGRVAKARNAYLQAVEGAFAGDFEIQKQNAAMRLLADLKRVADEQFKEVSALVDKLGQVHERFQQGARSLGREAGRMPHVLSTDITSPEDVESYYNRYAREVSEELTRFIDQIGSLYDWRDRLALDIAQDIFNFVREPFEPVTQEKIEQIIEAKHRQISLEQRLEELREDSIPFWNYNPVRMQSGGDLESIRVIGVEDGSHSIFVEAIRARESLVTTRDHHQVTVLHTKHGLPIFALQQIDDWRRKYEEHISRRRSPLHLFPALPWVQDIKAGKQWFAVAEALGFITKKGVWYYCTPKDSRLDPIRLAQGLEVALDRFLSDPQLLSEIQEMIEAKIAEIGNDEAAIAIYEYEHRQRSPGPVAKIELELQLAAGEFRQQMGYDENRVIAVQAKKADELGPTEESTPPEGAASTSG